jgi:1,4-dihydroxy-2-naphthoyl-CoA hydrolase
MTMKEACEKCRAPLALDAEAHVCSYECTFCRACAAAMAGVCPNCGGELLRRPRRLPREAAAAATVDPAVVTGWHRGHLPELLGIRFVHATKDQLVAELTIRDELTTVGDRLHGGAIMAFADTVGATATALNLPPGASTTTLESKTNFFAGGRAGVVRAEATPLHRGGRTMVWQTRVTDESGKLLALTVQTQIVLT